jgi:hypothetical protein
MASKKQYIKYYILFTYQLQKNIIEDTDTSFVLNKDITMYAKYTKSNIRDFEVILILPICLRQIKKRK